MIGVVLLKLHRHDIFFKLYLGPVRCFKLEALEVFGIAIQY